MENIFIKKYWNEEDILFYLHFQNNEAVRQIEISSERVSFLTKDNFKNDNVMMYDQSLEELDLQESDFITEDEFIKVWNNR